jgi:hypothetical protein
MGKMRTDSAWSRLTAEQRETLEGWLFDEHLGYKEALERAQKEFGITSSLTSLADYYQRRARERTPSELAGLKDMIQKIEKAPVDRDALADAAMTLVAKRMVQLAVESPEKVRELASLGRLLVANETQETRMSWLQIEQDRIYREFRKEAARQERYDKAMAQAFPAKAVG